MKAPVCKPNNAYLLMNKLERSYLFTLVILIAAVLAAFSDGWGLIDRVLERAPVPEDESHDNDKKDSESMVSKSSVLVSRVIAQLTCDELEVSDFHIESLDTPAAESGSGMNGRYMTGELYATLDDEVRRISAEGNGKGPGAETRATGMLVDNLVYTLKQNFPDC